MIDSVAVGPSTTHTHTVVFLHGRGDVVSSFMVGLRQWRDSQGQSLIDSFPSFRWVFPQAKTMALASMYGEEWPQWFDVWNTKDFSDRQDHQAIGLKTSVTGLRTLLAKEASILNNQWDHLVLAGMSQGGAASIHTLLNLKLGASVAGQRRLAALLCFSSRMPFPSRSLVEIRNTLKLEDVPEGNEIIRNTPMQLQHCTNDSLVGVEYGRATRDALQRYGGNVDWKEYASGGHWFQSPQGIEDTLQFIRKHVLRSGEEGEADRQEFSTPGMDQSQL